MEQPLEQPLEQPRSVSLRDARQQHYDRRKEQTNAILDKYKHYKYFDAVNKELNNPKFMIQEADMDEIQLHDTNGYIVDMNDVIELGRMLNLFNNMRKWPKPYDDILPDNHSNFVADLSDLLQAINSTNPHKIGSMHIGTFGEKIVKNQGGKRSKKRSKKHCKKRSKKNMRRCTTSRRRSRARRSI
jgi:hypothetical protein